MSIELHIREHFTSPMPPAQVARALADIPAVSRHIPGVQSVRETAPLTFEWTLKERHVFGQTFQGVYCTRYKFASDHVAWQTVYGNMESEGEFQLHATDSGTRVLVLQKTRIPIEPPALLKRGVELMIQREMVKGLGAMFDHIHLHVADTTQHRT